MVFNTPASSCTEKLNAVPNPLLMSPELLPTAPIEVTIWSVDAVLRTACTTGAVAPTTVNGKSG